MVKLSVVIITYNEEQNIERCLNSLSGIADEIVVVDSFSSDNTPDICKKHNLRFIQHPFEGYVQQKNWALQQARYDYVLSLDADEELSDKLRESIIKIKEKPQHDGYFFNRRTIYCGQHIKHGGWYPDRKMRLVKKQSGEWKGVNSHDKLEVVTENAKIKFLKGTLLHYSFNSISEHLKQMDKFTEMQALDMFLNKYKCPWHKLIINPIWKFKKDYIFRMGFLDGFYGFVIAAISAFATFMKYSKLLHFIRKNSA